MKTKDLVMAAILLSIGTVLHFLPGIASGMKPDFLLAMMFVAIMIQPYFKNTLAIGIAAGLLAALTTNFPAGQLPSILDKIISALAFLGIYKIFAGSSKTIGLIPAGVLMFICTIISGTVFLGSALFMAGLPAPFGVLFLTVVIPTSIANIVFGLVVYKVYLMYAKRAIA